jgi:2-methylisocitrate lyase-like PEP mutase family enzyme
VSGGYFTPSAWQFSIIADDIEDAIKRNQCGTYSLETMAKFAEAARTIRRAVAMAERVDYLLSDDDGEDDFHKRWKEVLDA